MKRTYNNPNVPIWKANVLKKEPTKIVYNAVYDITEKDRAIMKYRELQAAQSAKNLLKKP